MKLYHGSTVTVKSPNIQKGRKATDFGKGFYTTTNFEQAKKWAILKRNREHGKKAVVSVYEVPDNILDREFSVLRFEGATKEWLEFVVNNRRGKGKNSYDLIMGPVANDQLYATIRLYEQGVVTVERRRNLHKRWQKSRFSRGVEYNQYFHRKKLILKTKKNDYG